MLKLTVTTVILRSSHKNDIYPANMLIHKFFILFSILLIVCNSCLLAQFSTSIGSRPASMGESFVAISGDPYSIFYNPAGTANIQKISIPVAYKRHLFGMTNGAVISNYVSGVLPIEPVGNFSFGFFQRGIDNFVFQLLSQEFFIINYSRVFFKNLSAGINYKNLSTSWNKIGFQDNPYVESTELKSWGVDGGIIYSLFQKYYIGLSLENIISPRIALKEKLSETGFIKLGVVYNNKTSFIISSDIIVPVKNVYFNEQEFRFGFEKIFFDKLFLRFGSKILYKNKAILNEISVGGGFLYSKTYYDLSLDYSFTYLLEGIGLLGNHMFTMSFALNRFKIPNLYGLFKLLTKISFSEETTTPATSPRDVVPPSASIFLKPNLVRFNMDGIADTLYISTVTSDNIGINMWIMEIKKIERQSQRVVMKYSGQGKPYEILKWLGKDSTNKLIPNGLYNVSLRVSDFEGNITSAHSTFKVASKFNDSVSPKINLRPNLKQFSPDGNGINDEVEIKFNIKDDSEIDNWKLEIFTFDSMKVIKQVGGKAIIIPLMIWRGEDNNGQIVKEGKYIARMYARDECENSAYSDTITLDVKFDKKEALQKIAVLKSQEPRQDDAKLERDKKRQIREEERKVRKIRESEEKEELEKMESEQRSSVFIEVPVSLTMGENQILLSPILFDEKNNIQSPASAITMIGVMLQEYPERSIQIESKEENLKVAIQRAEALKNALVGEYNIQPDRIKYNVQSSTKKLDVRVTF